MGWPAVSRRATPCPGESQPGARRDARHTPDARPPQRTRGGAVHTRVVRLPGPLVSPRWLLDHVGDPSLRIVDTRWYLGRPGAGRQAYAEAHLPDAVFVDLDRELTAPSGDGRHPLPDPAVFAAALSRFGVGDRTAVVAYDDAGAGVAGRLWWMLDSLGFADVAVLDGGIAAWTAEGGALTAEVPEWPQARLSLAPAWRGTIDREALRARLGALLVLDGRAPERYRGEIEPIDPAAGHIPTARSAPLAGNLTTDGRFLPAKALADRFRSLGEDAAADVVVYCGSGTNACQLALSMRVAGLPDPLLYPGSWSDWSTAGFPVATGPDPGEPR